MSPAADSARFRRLGQAVEAFLSFRDQGGDAEEFLTAHGDLRDLLEPMLRDQAAADAPPSDGRFLAGFELLREIGRGGMGIVYEAKELALGRRVALKVLPARLGITPRNIERFRREAAAAARVRHPGIVPIYSVGEVDGTHYFAMELIDGNSLGQVVADLRARCADDPAALVEVGFPGKEGSYFAAAADVVAQAANAVAAAHEGGVLHRDLKPHNLLLAGDGTVRVVDFGLAKDLERRAVSCSGEVAGTPNYMSPEQAVGGRQVDERTDVYALGVVLYELLTLRTPFVADHAAAVLAAIVSDEPPSPRRFNPRVPRELETICLAAIEKDPRHRYGSASELAADLQRFLRHEPIVARPPGSVTRLVKLLRRRRTAALACTLAFLALVVGPIGFALYQRRVHDELARQQAETARQRDLAEENFARARRFVEQLLDRAEQLAKQPGMELVHRQMAEDALRYYGEFLAGEAAHPELVTAALQTHVLVGRIHHHLGQHEEAKKALDAAIARAVPRGAAAPHDVRLVAVAARRHRAAALRALGQREEARLDHAAARGEAAELLAGARDPGQRRAAAVALAEVLFAAATTALEDLRDLAAAEADVGQAEELLRDGPRTVSQTVLLVDVLRRRAELCRSAGRPRDGVPFLEAGQREIEGLVGDDARDPTVRLGHSNVVAELGATHQALAAPAVAEPLLAKAVAVREALVRDFPRNQAYRFALATGLLDRSAAQSALGQGAAAVATAERAATLAGELTGETKDSIAYTQLLLSAENFICLMRGNLPTPPAELEAAYRRSLERHRDAVARFADVPNVRSRFGASASNLARFLTGHDRAAEALPLIEEAIAHQRAAFDADPSVARYRDFLGKHYMVLAAIRQHQADADGLAASGRALAALNEDHSYNLGLSAKYLSQAATILRRAGKDGAAEPLEHEAIALVRRAFVLDDHNVRNHVRQEPDLRPLSRYPEFVELLKQ